MEPVVTRLEETTSYDFSNHFHLAHWLEDPVREVSKRQQLAKRHEHNIVEKYKACHASLKSLMNASNSSGPYSNDLTLLRRLKRERDALEHKVNDLQSGIDENHVLDELTHQVSQKTEEALAEERLRNELKIQVVGAKHDFQEQKKSVRATMESLKHVKDAYKNVLGIHVSVLHQDKDCVEFLLTYSKTRPVSVEPMPLNSVRIKRSCSKPKWTLIATNPLHPRLKELSQKLEESQDIQGLLVLLKPSLQFLRV